VGNFSYKKAEFALKKSEQHAHALIAAIPDLIFMIDGNGVFLDFKPAMSDPSFDPAIMIGKKISQIAPPEIASLVETRIRHILQTGQMHIDEYRIPLPEKGIVDFEARAVCGANKEVIAIVRDISQRKRDEAMILDKNQQLQKLNAEKDKFFSIIAHDLKSPFNAIMGFSELLVERIGEKDYRDVGKYADIILQSSQRAVDLLMNLMEWSRSQTGRMKFSPDEYDLQSIIDDIALLLYETAQQKSITISTVLPDNLTVFADNEMLNTVIRNLISNAIKFTMPGGRIIIAAEEKKHELTVSVSDTGVGIPKEAMKKIFSIQENYTTTGTQNEKGTGLGLILCKEFVEKHGGKIWVESKKEKGTVFTFSLPRGRR